MPGTSLGAGTTVGNKRDKILLLVEFIVWREKTIDNTNTFFRMLVLHTLKKKLDEKED